MGKELIFSDEARSKIKKGADVVAKAVGSTIGPFGRNVVLESPYGGPTITNDGVSIAKDISLKDRFENLGAEIIKEVAVKTNEQAGDGTSTSVVLAIAMMEEGLKQVDKGVNALSVKSGMDKAHATAREKLEEMKKSISSDEEIRQIASVASESQEFGEIIATTVKKIGERGVVTVEESQSFGIDSEMVEGMEIDRGFISPYMITNTERAEAEYKDVPILLTDKKISSVKEILPLLEKVTQSGVKDLVIIAEDVDGEALTTFVVNKLRGSFNVLCIKAPGFGNKKKDILEDIAITVGATVVSQELGMSFEGIGLEVLGKANKVASKKDRTIIVGTGSTSNEIEKRVKDLEVHLESAESYETSGIEERIAKLKGGVAVIKVGAATEAEMKYLKLKIEDAVNATKAAIEEGVVQGGGVALAKVASYLREKKNDMEWSDEYEEKGYNIVIHSLEAPFTRIVENALGNGEGKAVLRKVQDNDSGYDAKKREFVDDMFDVGIIDPVKVTRSGLMNAISTVGVFLTTEVAIVDIPKEDGKVEMPGMM